MRAAMNAADVGDDVFHEDPSVNKLEERVAALLGKEAALFAPSGTMSNQICVKVHTQPGDEMLCDVNCHIYNNEAGGPAVLSGLMCRTLEGDFGILDVDQLSDKIRPVNDHLVRTRLVCLENTHNRCGGRVYPLEKIKAISAWTHAHGLILHLDGARLWNAIVASGIPAKTWAAEFDSVSVCFSKGLGAPVGSALAGTREFITKARRVRKLFGGGMRQAGVIAAAALLQLGASYRPAGGRSSQCPGPRASGRGDAGIADDEDEGRDQYSLDRSRTHLGTEQGFLRGAERKRRSHQQRGHEPAAGGDASRCLGGANGTRRA